MPIPVTERINSLSETGSSPDRGDNGSRTISESKIPQFFNKALCVAG